MVVSVFDVRVGGARGIELHVAIPTDREFTSPSRYAISMVARASSSLEVTCLGDPLVKLESPTSLSNTN